MSPPWGIQRRAPDAKWTRCCWPECREPIRADPLDEEAAPPLCTAHIIAVTAYGTRVAQRLAQRDYDMAHRTPRERHPVVYYVRVGDHVKIGTTVDLTGRLRAMYLDESYVLATEPGSYDIETQRHKQFADERVNPRRELFNPSRRLMAHIDTLRATA